MYKWPPVGAFKRSTESLAVCKQSLRVWWRERAVEEVYYFGFSLKLFILFIYRCVQQMLLFHANWFKIHQNRLHSKWTWFSGSRLTHFQRETKSPNRESPLRFTIFVGGESRRAWILWQTFVVSTIWIRIGVLIVPLQMTNTHHVRLSSLSVSLSPHFLPSLSRFSFCPASQGNCCPSTYRFRAKILPG